MGKLQSYKRIITSDYQTEDQELIEQLGASLNDVIDDHQNLLSGKITLRDNIFCTVKDVELTVDANGGTGNTRIGLNTNNQVIGTLVILATNLTNSSIYPVSAPFISFTQLEKSLLLNNITGLPPGYRWRLRIVAWN